VDKMKQTSLEGFLHLEEHTRELEKKVEEKLKKIKKKISFFFNKIKWLLLVKC